MSPDGRGARWRVVGEPEPEVRPVPLDVELEAIDRQLAAAGVRARLAGRANTQPTRYFAQQLESNLRKSLERGGGGAATRR